jgi:signal transduction histidine kinase/AmiR/NasT family two-component response regulator
MLKAVDPVLPCERRSELEMEVRRDLVNTLYTSTRSLAVGALAGAFIAFTIAMKAGGWPLTVAAALISLSGIARIGLSIAYRARRSTGQRGGKIWEDAYQFGAAGYSGLLGGFTLLTLLTVRDPMLHMLATTTAIGYAAAVAGRNAGRPTIAVTQLTLATLPVALGLLLTANGLYRVLGLVTLLFYAGMIDITIQTYNVVLRAFRNARENQALVEAVQIKVSEANAANEAKTHFLANMSHEIRTPLNGVLGMTEAMLADALNDQQRLRLKVIRQSGGALLTLLNDILDLSKVEAGKLELASAPFDLGELLESVAAAFQDSAAKRSISLSMAVSETDVGMYEGDSGRLRQILFNLISNALKFTEKGGVEVKVVFDGETLAITVADTGIGIAPDHLERLFQRFSQADASTTRRFGGTGLGLAICQELASLLKGRIWAESQLSEGATFFVSVPLVRLAAPSPGALPTAAPAPSIPAAPAHKVRLLCAEDNEVNQMVLRALLEPFDYDLIIVDNGLQALDAFQREAFDLILLDIQMPVMDGPAAAAAIRLYEAQMNRPNTPIIALTANVMADQVKGYLALGMNQVIPKPINIDELYGAIQRHLASSDREDQVGYAEQMSQTSAVAG